MTAAQIDFQQLRIKHILYKSKVRSTIYGGTYDAVFFSREGPLNTWFNTIGLPKYRQQPEMIELFQIQQELNGIAGSLNELYKTGKIEQAHEGLSRIEDKSEKFLVLLSQLETKFS